MEWNGMEQNVTEWNGMERNGTECNGMERNGTEWNGMEWNATKLRCNHRTCFENDSVKIQGKITRLEMTMYIRPTEQ